ncbi:hypothetical protein QZM97_23720 [Burkholderia orbicola]|uniref:hypothetical protein n=1 Tax=Burkholderia orbicola TaxID=2978683 RepID=UPI00264F4AB7|nr:hypothetical protein [Burkholderia orbicola]MDN7993087.1 hypothetical protein [Burkholderia orbicola]
MSNSTTLLDQISSTQVYKELVANSLFDAMSPASLWGRRAAASFGLTWAYYGGYWTNSAGTSTLISNGTVSCTASATTYIMGNPTTGAVTSNTTGFTAGLIPLYSVVSSATQVTSWLDYRSYQPSVTGGSLQSIANEGSGVGIYDTGSTGGNAKLKSLIGGTGISVVDNGNGTVTINSSGSTGTVTGGANEGAGVGILDATNSTASSLKYKTLVAGTGVTVTDNGTSGISLGASAAAAAGPAVQQAGSTIVSAATTLNFTGGAVVTQPSTGIANITWPSPYGVNDTPPLLSALATTVNGASSTIAQQNWGVEMSTPSQAGEFVTAIVMSAPSTPYQCVVRLKVVPLLTAFNGAGIVLRDSGTGRLQAFGLHSQFTGTGFVGVKNYNSPTSFNAAQYSTLGLYVPPPWIRIRDDGTNLYWDISNDGSYWLNLTSFARTTWLANPNQIGLFVNANQAAIAATFFSFYAGV